MAEWLKYLTADQLFRVIELPWANKYLHQVTELKPGLTSILGDSSTPLSRLQKLTVVYALNSSGHWPQRFERALS